MTLATGLALLYDAFPFEERGKALGISVAGIYLGISAGPFLGGIIATHLGWRFVFYIGMHVDSHQNRPGWKGATEKDLCELRLKLARMIHEEAKGTVSCSFNATIYRDTLPDIPMLTRFAHEHIDIIQTMVYILFRSARKKNNFDVFANGRPVDVGNLVYQLDNQENHQDLVSQEIADAIRLAYPDHEPCAYLNGSEDSRSMKWLLTLRAGTKDEILGYLDPKFAEWTQIFHHLFFGTYLAYSRPCWMRWFQKLLPLAPFNKSLRKVFGRLLAKPKLWTQPLNIQSIMRRAAILRKWPARIGRSSRRSRNGGVVTDRTCNR